VLAALCVAYLSPPQIYASLKKIVVLSGGSIPVSSFLRESFRRHDIRDVPVADENIGEHAAIDILSMRDDVDIALSQKFGQPLSRFKPTGLGQFRGIQAAQANALGAVSNGVPIHRLYLPTFKVPRLKPETGQHSPWQLNRLSRSKC
jgi:hypothetical protein